MVPSHGSHLGHGDSIYEQTYNLLSYENLESAGATCDLTGAVWENYGENWYQQGI